MSEDRIQFLIDRIAADSAELQALYQPTTPPSGTVLHVTTAAELVQALATVVGPAEIRLAAGIYSGNFVLRNRAEVAMVTICADLELAPFTMPWVLPAQMTAAPQLVPADPGRPIVACEHGAHHYTLRALAIGPNTARPDYTLLELGGEATDLSQVPHDLEVDACYIHGDPATGCRRGISLQSSKTIIRRCYVSDCWYQGQDAQAIACWASPGDLLIECNYLAGSGENLIIGGSDPKIPNLVPSGITIRGNYLFKPNEWRQYGGSVKNSLELKNAKDVLIENNVLEGCWVDGQPGHCVVFTIRNQDGGAPWSTVQEVVFCWNVVKDVEGCFVNLLGIDDNYPSVRGAGMRIEENLFVNGGGGVQSLSGYQQTHITHNAFTGPDWKWLSFGGQPAEGFVYLDNAVPPTEYGITGDDCGIGLPSLERYVPGYDMRCNSIGMKGWVNYPDGNYLLDLGTPPADYLTQTASDSRTVGPDLAELQRRIPWYPLPVLGRTWVVRPESHKKPKPFGMR